MARKFLNARVRLLQLANNDSAVETESQCSHVIILKATLPGRTIA
jgi:hypothetical protein